MNNTAAAALVPGDTINLAGEILAVAAVEIFAGTIGPCVEITFTDGTGAVLPATYIV